jgi:ribonuclease HII
LYAGGSGVWRIGIDEAGYGPNFGPLVMSAVACRVPPELAEACMWKTLRRAVKRVGGRRVAHLLVDDSKKVYQAGKGLADLERTVLAALLCLSHPDATCLADLIARLCADGQSIVEPWYHGQTLLPQAAASDHIQSGAKKLRDALDGAAVSWGPIYSVVINTPQFNDIVDRFGSKGAVLAVGLLRLLRSCLAHEPATDAFVVVDKHGGRNFYGPMLQELSPDCWVIPLEERMERSVYEIRWQNRTVRLLFRPEADGTSFEVALASIVSKYLRELCMEEFNEYWRRHVPEVKRTAGYPGDSSRFLADIRPALERMQVPLDQVWRKR